MITPAIGGPEAGRLSDCPASQSAVGAVDDTAPWAMHLMADHGWPAGDAPRH